MVERQGQSVSATSGSAAKSSASESQCDHRSADYERDRRRTGVHGAVEHLPPSYFALVMATGIISIVAWDFQLAALSVGLFAFNLIAYAVLAALTMLRALRYTPQFFADMTDHRLGPGF